MVKPHSGHTGRHRANTDMFAMLSPRYAVNTFRMCRDATNCQLEVNLFLTP